MNKNHIFTYITISLLILTLLSNVVLSGTDDQQNEGTYYFAYGDSITAGKSMTPSYSFEKAYMERMRILYDPSNTSDHIGYEGGGNKVSFPEQCAWDPNDVHDDWFGNPSTRYFYNWTNWTNQYFIFMLGINDYIYFERYELTWNHSIYNVTSGMMRIYNETLQNGSIPIMCNPTGCDGGSAPYNDYEDYSAYYNATFEIYKNYSVKCVPMWDAVDLIPWNGHMEQFDVASYRGNGVHPNEAGHNAMAWMLYYFIRGWDYNETYYPNNFTMLVEADYNETIFINNTYWVSDCINITCLTNDSFIDYTLQTNYNGTEVIRFFIQKGSVYQIQGNVQFISINGQTNGTSIYDSTPTFIWTTDSSAVQYQLQIATDFDFTSLVVKSLFAAITRITVNGIILFLRVRGIL